MDVIVVVVGSFSIATGCFAALIITTNTENEPRPRSADAGGIGVTDLLHGATRARVLGEPFTP